MFVLDTNVVSEMRKIKAGKANPGVTQWASTVSAAQMFLSSITIHELEHGVLLVERTDPEQGSLLRRWLDESVTAAFDQRILAVDESVARASAGFHVPDPAPFRDALIGATAVVNDMAVVTRNIGDFERFDGLEVLNPWS